ncbi:MAG: MMPL family transporter [Demequina sp.]|jgi:RND superfamily putative drug exporter|nr:MMPL family transporter [Demequina sp.]
MRLPTWLRPVLIAVAVLAWLGVASAGGQTFGKLSSVQENDAAVFLPESAESTQAAQWHAKFVPVQSVPGLFVVDGLAGEDDLAKVQAFADAAAAAPIAGDPKGRTVDDTLLAPPTVIPSEDGAAALVTFSVSAEAYGELVGEDTLGEFIASTIVSVWEAQDTGLDGYLTGAMGFVADLLEAFAGIDGVLLLVALGVVLLILLIVYRSPVLPFLVLATAMIALTAAILVVYQLAARDVITLNGQAQGIMFILVVGATTDYALLMVARYREELLRNESPYTAMWVAWRRSLEPIAASAGTVAAGLLVLLLSDLKSLQSLGPAGAVGIAAALLAVLTLLPALLLIGGRHARGVFWPRRPAFVAAEADHPAGMWDRIASGVRARPRRTWLLAAGVLVLMAAFLPMLKVGGIGNRDYFLNNPDSVKGLAVLEEHFDAGSTSPVRIIVPQEDAEAVAAAVAEVDGISAVYPLTESTASGQPPVDGEQPIVVDGHVEIVAVTQVAATDAAAADVVADVRAAVAEISPTALVGGEAAEALDTRLTTQRDAEVIIPAVLLVIFVVLILLLRALVAPAVILLANILSFAAALGLSALVFTVIFDFPGVDLATILLAFVFLVALGVDYSIFLMSRAREESLTRGTRAGVERALAVTGGVITSAGVVLAATFAALSVIPLIFLAQIAFIVSAGVLIDTIIVRSLLIPGTMSDLGRYSWAPWHRAFKD